MEDHYDTLGVHAGVSRTEIERSYRRLARANHPDLLQQATPAMRAEAEAKLKRVNIAYAILGNPARRLAYDREHSRRRDARARHRRPPMTRPRARPAATTAHWHGGGPVMMEWAKPPVISTPSRRAEPGWLPVLLWAAAAMVLFAVILALVWRPAVQVAPSAPPIPTPIR